ncbi:MAG: ATP-binding cassette domain-containing protein [Parachlamydiales bacterium]|jgi:ABC-type polar amino acid transport system ATPase subunit
MLTLKNISLFKGRNREQILDSITVEMKRGSITLLLGKSGSGKTSLLRCIAQLENSYEGEISYDGQALNSLDSKSRARIVNYIAQSYPLFPHMTALQNCVKPLELIKGFSRRDAEEKAMQVLDSLGMGNYANSYPHNLSGGQKQRIAISCALALDSDIFLFDEPTSALDPQNTELLSHLIQNLRKEGKCIVISTQDMSFASQLLDKAYLLENGRMVDSYPSTEVSSQILHFIKN